MAAASPSNVTTVHVIVFPGTGNLAMFAAEAQGFFRQEEVRLELTYTRTSREQLLGLIEGKWDIAHTAVDNVIAYTEEGADLMAFMGLDSSTLSLWVQPGISSFDQLRGSPLAVDAVHTAFALVLRRILLDNGLGPDDYQLVPIGGTDLRFEAMREGRAAGTLMTPPFDVLAERAGLRCLGRINDYLSTYQGGVGACRREWAWEHRELLVRYIRGYVAGLRWVMDPANRAQATALLQERLQLSSDVAAGTLDSVLNPAWGLLPEARLRRDGIRVVIELRGQMGFLQEPLPAPEKYYDLSYYEEALQGVS
ncbi:MAG: ABC transporter substrate-binding protein [Dehalococcoidia bacterium]